MARYRYQATNAAGTEVAGEVEAESLAAAAAQVESLGLRVVALRDASASDTDVAIEARRGDRRLRDAAERLVALGEFALQPLDAYRRDLPTGRRRREMRRLINTIRGGDADAVARAAARAPMAWAALLASMPSAASERAPSAAAPPNGPAETPAETSAANQANGPSDEPADTRWFADFLRRESAPPPFGGRLVIASLYPVAILALAFFVVWPVSVLLVPQFAAMYREFGLSLPAATESVLAVGEGISVVGGIPAVVVFCLIALALATWPFWRPRFVLAVARVIGLPAYGNGNDAAALAACVADLTDAGLPVEHAARVATSGRRGPDALEAARRPALRAEIKRDEPQLLRDLAMNYAERSEGQVAWTRGIAGPTATFVLVTLVGFVAVALFLPMVKLIEGLT